MDNRIVIIKKIVSIILKLPFIRWITLNMTMEIIIKEYTTALELTKSSNVNWKDLLYNLKKYIEDNNTAANQPYMTP